MNPIRDLYNSFNTDKGGFSLRKLSAFVTITGGATVSIWHATPENTFMIVCANYTFGLLALGLVTASQLISLKTGSTSKETLEIKKTNETTDV